MNDQDPRATAFVLGELEDEDSRVFRDLVERDPDEIEHVEELRDVSALMQESLQETLPLELTQEQRAAIVAAIPAPVSRRVSRSTWTFAAAAALALLGSGAAATLLVQSAADAPRNQVNAARRTDVSLIAATEPAALRRRIVMVNRNGQLVSEVAPPGFYHSFTLSPDGRYVAVDQQSESGHRDIWVRELSSSVWRPTGDERAPVWSRDGRSVVWTKVDSTPAGLKPSISPDGRWVAYTSNESGRPEVYVRSFAPGTTFRVSTDGAIASRWRANGREMFYVAPGGRLMAVDVAARGNSLNVGAPRLLFQMPEPRAAEFEVSRDGERFILFGNAGQDEGRVSGRVIGLSDTEGVADVQVNFVGPFAGQAERALASFPLMPEEIADRLGIAQVSATTDAQGRFTVFAPTAGLYALVFRRDGYVGAAKPGDTLTSPLVTTTVTITEGAKPAEITITLVPKN